MQRIKHLLLVEGLTLAGARRKLEEESEPVRRGRAANRRADRLERAAAAHRSETRVALDSRSLERHGRPPEFALTPTPMPAMGVVSTRAH